MMPGVHVICFAASYFIALVLEITRLWVRASWRRPLVIGITSAGLVAHTWYLGQRVVAAPTAPLASHYDWFLAAAWLVVVVTLLLWFYFPRSPAGFFSLPVILALISASQFATTAPLASFQAPRFWGRVHAICLMLGTVAVICGFLAGVMYLWQSYRLKQKMPPGDRFLLPSLEWLERVNSRSLGFSTLLVGVGFITGVLGRLAHEGDQGIVPWTDPVVLSLAAMLGWLIIAEIFRLIYPAARQGRKVAYLTLAAFVFLLITLVSVALLDQVVHSGREGANVRKLQNRNPKSEINTKSQIQRDDLYLDTARRLAWRHVRLT